MTGNSPRPTSYDNSCTMRGIVRRTHSRSVRSSLTGRCGIHDKKEKVNSAGKSENRRRIFNSLTCASSFGQGKDRQKRRQ